ncbi:MAG: hypothetical protein AAGA58_01595 [Verrucomicrobiota bacterium]
MNLRIVTYSLVLFWAVSLNSAHSGSLIGDEMTATWRFNQFGDINTFTVTNAVELQGDFGATGTLDVGQNSFLITLLFTSGIGAGVIWEFTDLDFSDPNLVVSGFSVDTNYVGWSDSFVSFSDDSVTVNFGNSVSMNRNSNSFLMTLQTSIAPTEDTNPTITTVSLTNSQITLEWDPFGDETNYKFETSPTLLPGSWAPIGTPVTDGSTTTTFSRLPGSLHYFRVISP